MEKHRHPRAPVLTTTAGATVNLYQDSDGTTAPSDPNLAPSYVWCVISGKLDQEVTLVHRWGATLTTADESLVIINGPTQAGETLAADTWFERAIRLMPGRNKIDLVLGTPAPTAAYVAVELNSYPGLVQ